MTTSAARLPRAGELPPHLFVVSPLRKTWYVVAPFASFALFLFAALHDAWALAVLAAFAFAFVGHGSLAHDLVHRSLRLPRWLNAVLLSLVEALGLRSGRTFRRVHHHHHRRFPRGDDVEGRPAHMRWTGALAAGLDWQPRNVAWTWRHHPEDRAVLVREALLVLALVGSALLALPTTVALVVWCGLQLGACFVYPLATAKMVHDPSAQGELLQTRRFRGRFFHAVFFGHLYHLEHHLYPGVPHTHWAALARRLDPALDAARVPRITASSLLAIDSASARVQRDSVTSSRLRTENTSSPSPILYSGPR